MKKKIWIPIAAVIAFLAILFIPIPTGTYKDGGTREYTALTYKAVHWRRLVENVAGGDRYEKTRVYLFPNNFKSIDRLWDTEVDNVECKVAARITRLSYNFANVKPLNHSTEEIRFCIDDLEDIEPRKGMTVEVTYRGSILGESPVQVDAVSWKTCGDLRQFEYEDTWINVEEKSADEITELDGLIISEIYKNCFLAADVPGGVPEYKFNGTLPDGLCPGDMVFVTFENFRYDKESRHIEAEMLTVEPSDFDPGSVVYAKPVIYLYPEKETEVSVKLTLDGDLTCTYPEYNEGWSVMASPDGTLTDDSGQTYNYLYWEGETFAQYDLSRGFCVKGEDTAQFLEGALEKLGLNRREANEFIVYWLPLMQDNPYNIISFQTDAYTDAARLDITPAPDTLIRVFMAWHGADSYTELEAQELCAPARNGFTVVEWGGTQVK